MASKKERERAKREAEAKRLVERKDRLRNHILGHFGIDTARKLDKVKIITEDARFP